MLPTPPALRPVRRALRRLRDRARRAAIVLLYHRVAEVEPDPWSLCVAPAHFEEQMAVLAARGDVGTLGDLSAAVAAGRRPPHRVVVTFDDGYADVAETALPTLERAGIPATLFVTTGGLGGAREFWWDTLERCVLSPEALPADLTLAIGGRVHEVRTVTVPRAELHDQLHGLLGHAAAWERETALRALASAIGIERMVRPTHRRLSATDVRTLGRHALVTLGAHSVSHPYLSALAPDEQAREIGEGRRFLQALTGVPVLDFSYPHGDHDVETVRLVRQAGFRSACGTQCETAWSGSEPYAIPRIEVPDLDGEGFARWLTEWVGAA